MGTVGCYVVGGTCQGIEQGNGLEVSGTWVDPAWPSGTPQGAWVPPGGWRHCATPGGNAPARLLNTDPGLLAKTGHRGLKGAWQGLWLADPEVRRWAAAADHVKVLGARPPLTGGIGAPIGEVWSSPLPSGPLAYHAGRFPPPAGMEAGPLWGPGGRVCVCVCVYVCVCVCMTVSF